MNSDLLIYEKDLWDKGTLVVAGVDEVGRGCIAGPLVTAAVVWQPEIATLDNEDERHEYLYQITDSKKLTEKKRLMLSQFIMDNCSSYAIVEISPAEIDGHGVGEANKNAITKVISKVTDAGHALIDHFKVDHDTPTTSITKGDAKSISIASASIVAKVYRDGLMKEKYHTEYPQYGFDSHVGYGTKRHIDAIREHGYTPIHRRSFKINL